MRMYREKERGGRKRAHLLQEPFDNLDATPVGRRKEDRVSVVVLLIQRRAVLKQEVDQVEVATPRGKQQRCVAVVVALVEREALLEEPLHQIEMPALKSARLTPRTGGKIATPEARGPKVHRSRPYPVTGARLFVSPSQTSRPCFITRRLLLPVRLPMVFWSGP